MLLNNPRLRGPRVQLDRSNAHNPNEQLNPLPVDEHGMIQLQIHTQAAGTLERRISVDLINYVHHLDISVTDKINRQALRSGIRNLKEFTLPFDAQIGMRSSHGILFCRAHRLHTIAHNSTLHRQLRVRLVDHSLSIMPLIRRFLEQDGS